MADRRPLKRNLSTGTPREFALSDRAEMKGVVLGPNGEGIIEENGAGEVEVSDDVLTTPLTISQLRTAANNTFDNSSNGFTATQVQAAIEEVQDNVDAKVFGNDAAEQIKDTDETTTGSTFTEYDSLTFNVSDTGGTNTYRLNVDFIWGHDSASNDIRVRAMLDGVQVGEEIRIEPKDPGTDQRIQHKILHYTTNLSQGNHTWSLEYRPATASRTSRMYRSVLEVWRTK